VAANHAEAAPGTQHQRPISPGRGGYRMRAAPELVHALVYAQDDLRDLAPVGSVCLGIEHADVGDHMTFSVI